MIMNDKMKMKSLKKNNSGSALIVCIIILLFVSILATVILYMSGINYRMKKNEYNTKVSFYDGEIYLERIQGNLIIPVSEAMGNAYRMTNSHFISLATEDARRQDFYDNFNNELKDILLNNYGVSDAGITNNGPAPSDSAFVKNIIHNLTSSGPNTGDGIPVSQIYVNDGSISGVPYATYSDPSVFVNLIADNHPDYFAGDSDPDKAKYYICVYGDLNQGSGGPIDEDTRRDLNYGQFVTQDVTNPATGALAEADKCRLLMKNVCVVCVRNGYRSIISTDIAIQYPPLDWDTGASTDPVVSWNVYQLIYYINWKNV